MTSTLRHLERLLGTAGIAAITAWAVGGARPAAPATVVRVEAPRPALQRAVELPARCGRAASPARGPRRDPFQPAAIEPTPPETPAQPLPERIVTVAGTPLSTAGLSRRQVRLLERLAEVPGLPTETIRGVRYVVANGRRYRDDCSNVLRVPYDALGVDLFSEHPRFPDANGVGLIQQKGARVEAPEVGDLVIFDDTWDRNRNGARDDPATHAAIVVGFEPGGTVLLYNRVRAGHRIQRMNLARPGLYRDPETGRRLNDFLRRKRPADPEDLPRTTGALFAGYVRVL